MRIIVHLGHHGTVEAVYLQGNAGDDEVIVVDTDASDFLGPNDLIAVRGDDGHPCSATIHVGDLEYLPEDCEIRRLLDEWDRRSCVDDAMP